MRYNTRVHSADDIAWPTLQRIVRDWAGADAKLGFSMPLVGGCINLTLLLETTDGRRAVLKIAPHRVNRTFEIEARQLRHLHEAGVPTPEVLAVHVADLNDPHSYLLMEFIEGITLCEAESQASPAGFEALQIELAGILAALHGQTAAQYGRIGAQETYTENWSAFYGSLYDETIEAIRRTGELPLIVRQKLDRMHQTLPTLLAHDDRPRLLHGDLWGGNVLCRKCAGEWRIVALIDPHLRFGHAESELAYIELFDICGRPFLDAYQRLHPIDAGYERVRKTVYQLYPLMHHVELFGQKFVPHLLRVADGLDGV